MDINTLRSSARIAISEGEKGKLASRLDAPPVLMSTSILSELLKNVISSPTGIYAEILESLYVLEACLKDQKSNSALERAEVDALYEWILDALLPKLDVAHGREEEVESPKVLSQNLKQFHTLSSLGTGILRMLNELFSLSNYPNPAKLAICLAAFTDRRDSWTGEVSFENTTYLLTKYDLLLTNPSILVEHILRGFIRPLFAKTKHPAITPLGRKSIQPTKQTFDFLNEAENKPWRFDKVHSVAVFRWVLQSFQERLLEENWPLIIPPLLILIDDDLTNSKTRGCELLTILLKITPPALLQRTGLGDVLNDAVMPCLSYLPPLTPEKESLGLLKEAYPALLTLAKVRYIKEEKRRERVKMLDHVLRKGVLSGYFHCGDNPRIVKLLVEQSKVLVEEMGLWSARHLKDLIPLLSNVLAAPFGTAYPPLLLAATQTLQMVVRTNWPRITAYRGEILRGLAFCWIRVMEDQPEWQNFQNLKQALRDTVGLLKAAVQNGVDIDAEIAAILESDERLVGLLMQK